MGERLESIKTRLLRFAESQTRGRYPAVRLLGTTRRLPNPQTRKFARSRVM
jgi:hypothetical protein